MSLEADSAAEAPGKNLAQQIPRLQACRTSVKRPTELRGTYKQTEKLEKKYCLFLTNMSVMISHTQQQKKLKH